MKCTIHNPNTGKKHHVKDFKFANDMADIMRKTSQVLVKSRPKTGGSNPRRAVLVLVEN